MRTKREKIFDKSGGRCWYCGCELKKGWHADHFHPIVRDVVPNVDKRGVTIGYKTGKECRYPELDTFENLVPSCPQCNNFKHSLPIEAYRSLISDQFINTLKQSTGLRQLQRLGLIDIAPKPVVFWYEKNNLSVPSVWQLLGVSQEALDTEWLKDNAEPNYYHQWIAGRMTTLRRMGSYWLVISITDD